MSPAVICQPTLQVDSGARGPCSVSCRLDPDIAAVLARTTELSDRLKSAFRVSVAEVSLPEGDTLPDVSGRYSLREDELRFIPTFPFDRGLKYRAVFDPKQLGFRLTEEPLTIEFSVPSEEKTPAVSEVTHVFPSCDVLPENLLRFYVCFSSSMQRGQAAGEISLLDSEEQPVSDALYRPPVELWDRAMERLTVLLDPGRLKRRVGPNIELGPPLKVGQKYTLQIGSGLLDRDGRGIGKTYRKTFLVGEPDRERVAVDSWKLLAPVTGTRQPLVLMFPGPLDWALLFRAISVKSAKESEVAGRVAVDQCETRWSFTPTSPWTPDTYRVCVDAGLEDVCGNNIIGAFDKPLRKGSSLSTQDRSWLTFRLR